jgi:hypothetical protein
VEQGCRIWPDQRSSAKWNADILSVIRNVAGTAALPVPALL